MATTAPTTPLSRRTLLTSAGALGLGALLAACGGDAASGGSGGGWSFTDDRGEKAETGRRPEKIVAFVSSAAALYDYGVTCTAIFGPSKPIDGKPNPQAGDLDPAELESLGEAWGEFNVEKYAALGPELLISNMFPPPDLWFVPEESRKKIFALAPAIGIKGAHTSLKEPLRRYEELAKALGGDTTGAQAGADKKRFKDAEKRLRSVAKANRGLKVLAMTGDQDNMYVAVPGSYTDLHYFRDLGVDVVEGKKSDEFGFWEFLSWENTDKYHADLIMVDNRTQAMTPAALAEKPTWSRLPAVEAGQTTPWSMEERYSYRGFAPVLERLADAIENAEKLG
ncbi:ABC transporter substrate-binding protein [Streptomyces sp. CMB-StM0423]|uniref:ABC transporter substrate-binding protein n=1 Tax=Streptomyces sp. CMB-StM0423 TaxID=2059884 RepID=UPI000C7068E4|nr:ABC transporter substrate-binding protein [Streptomyces sp. CMB-StM0423]AUH41791.1 ABC transporter substrate-binding protein [Streptomyces sp. CMB-StM0423]